MLKLHLDTDIGGDMDDLCALAMVLNWPQAELLAITTVAEHQGKRAGYARYALALADREDIGAQEYGSAGSRPLASQTSRQKPAS